MDYRKVAAIGAWAAAIALIAVIGCGGSGNPRSESVERFAGQYSGTMVGSDGSSTQVSLTISDAGIIAWGTTSPTPPLTFTPTEAGSIQTSGSFRVSGTTPANATVIISGQLTESASTDVGGATSCCLGQNLDGSGMVTNGSITMQVTFNLTGLASPG